jgi:hypothetical protein
LKPALLREKEEYLPTVDNSNEIRTRYLLNGILERNQKKKRLLHTKPYSWGFIDLTVLMDANCCNWARSKAYLYCKKFHNRFYICKAVEIAEREYKRRYDLFKLMNQENTGRPFSFSSNFGP